MIPIIIFTASMLLYIATLAPTISFFDSGEMIAGAYTLGVSHPPGYPVYVTLGKLFTFIPMNNIAFRVNLMSAFFASLTSVMVYYITRAMMDEGGDGRDLPGLKLKGFGIPEAAGMFCAFAFSLSYTLWAWAVVSKFYSLNAFIVSCILMLLVRWRRARSEEDALAGHSMSYIYLIAFLWGIAGVVHISQFVLIPMYLLYMLVVDWRVFTEVGRGRYGDDFTIWGAVTGIRLKVLVIMFFFFALGHSIYMHVPIRAAVEPLINWGGATNFTQFKWVYNREGYQSVGGMRSLPLFWQQMQGFDMVREFGWAGLVLILGGLWGHFRKDWRHFTVLLFGAVFMTLVIVLMGNPPPENIFLLEQFYIPVYIFLAIIMGGAVWLILKKSPAAPWIIGSTLAFIFLGDVPLKYIEGLFTGSDVSTTMYLMGMEYPPYLYFLFLAVMATVLIFSVRWLMKKDIAGRSAVITMLFAVAFLLYPAYQVKAHFWKNDRSANYVAYDMGNAELTFAPEFSVLFTWGDSGAFPMWYLQDVERKRPDILLVHTPHLPLGWFVDSIRRGPVELGDRSVIARDYSMLRDYNGIKGAEQMLAVPEDYRDSADMVKQIIEINPGRQFVFDYSSRYSLPMPYNVYPYGITYREFKDDYAEENYRIWPYLVTRGLPDPVIALDLDEAKAVSIYGYIHADVGRKYLDTGLKPFADREFSLALEYAPELRDNLAGFVK